LLGCNLHHKFTVQQAVDPFLSRSGRDGRLSALNAVMAVTREPELVALWIIPLK